MAMNVLYNIIEEINKKNIDLEKQSANKFWIKIAVSEFCAYDKVVFDAICRTFKPYGFNCKLARTTERMKDNLLTYKYWFKFERADMNDSLPF